MSGEYDWGMKYMVEDWNYLSELMNVLISKLDVVYSEYFWEIMSFDEVVRKCDELNYNNDCVEDLRYYCEELIYIEEE